MCGICGVLGINISNNRMNTMLSLLSHRGPDAQGIYDEDKAFFGHTRLSILDLSKAANQPMISQDGRYVIVFNGEIYNFLELRDQLASKGINFKTNSDTEVILYGFSVWGNDVFEKLNGIFAISIWDKLSKKTILARDRYGVKPLYYYNFEEKLVFASEIKAIHAGVEINNVINRQALVEFLKFGNPLGEQTMFENIKEVKPGEILVYENYKLEAYKFWSITNVKKLNVTNSEAIISVKSLLENAVKRQLISDVPVGIFLSGGIDSSLITAFASKHYEGTLNTYTAAFDFDKGVNELEMAKRIASHYGTNHHEIFIEGKNLPQVVEDLVVAHDSPFADAANIPLYLLTKQLKSEVKVILQGDGGDEFFAGYNRYSLLQKYRFPIYQKLASFLSVIFTNTSERGLRIRRIIDILKKEDDASLMADLLSGDSERRNTFSFLNRNTIHELKNYNANKKYEFLNELFSELDIVQKMLFIDTQIILPRTYLEKVDKSTMANSIEVRVPLLDNVLTEYVLGLKSDQKIRNGEKKWLLKQALRGVVPDFVLDGKKTGFGVPYENWLKDPLKELMLDTFHNESFKEIDLFDIKKLTSAANDHVSNKMNYGYVLWKLMNLGIWINRNDLKF